MSSTIKIVLALGLLAGVPTQSVHQLDHSLANDEIRKTESKLSQVFPIADSARQLFTVNADYVMQSLYDKNGVLIELRVVPKYVFSDTHPEWTEPDVSPHLTKQDFQHLLSLIEQANPLGQLKKEGRASAYVTNDQSPALDEYENAVIYRSMRSSRHSADQNEFQAKSLRVLFFHLVSGHLEQITNSGGSVEIDDVCNVRIDGDIYLIGRKDCKSLKVGHRISARAAGPLNESTD